MRLTSSAFQNDETIPKLYTCDGKNINPPLEFHDVPEEAKSFVLIMDDPDVPPSVRADRMWDHWVIFNIPPEIRKIPEGTTPQGILGCSTGGTIGYEGACPPDREHRYFFKLYALNCRLPLNEGATKKEIEHALKGHVLATASLMGRYDRKK